MHFSRLCVGQRDWSDQTEFRPVPVLLRSQGHLRRNQSTETTGATVGYLIYVTVRMVSIMPMVVHPRSSISALMGHVFLMREYEEVKPIFSLLFRHLMCTFCADAQCCALFFTVSF